jgi:hypothetical protein
LLPISAWRRRRHQPHREAPHADRPLLPQASPLSVKCLTACPRKLDSGMKHASGGESTTKCKPEPLRTPCASCSHSTAMHRPR